MIEGKRYEHSPVSEIRKKARILLSIEEKNPALVNSAVEFVTAAYYIHEGIGDPQRHLGLALKTARKLSLSEEEIQKAQTMADSFYSPANDSRAGTQDKERLMRREEKKQQMRKRFEWVMLTPIDKLRISQANQRKLHHNDYVYRNGNSEVKRKISSRTLTKQEYNQVFGNFQELEDPIRMNPATGFDHIGIAENIEALFQQKPEMVSRLGPKEAAIKEIILSLIRGQIISATALRHEGIDPSQMIMLASRYFREQVMRINEERYEIRMGRLE